MVACEGHGRTRERMGGGVGLSVGVMERLGDHAESGGVRRMGGFGGLGVLALLHGGLGGDGETKGIGEYGSAGRIQGHRDGMGRKEGMGVVWDKEGCGGHVGGGLLTLTAS